MSQFKSFQEFYPYYLSEHSHPTCRLLHFIGSSLSLIFLLIAFIAWQAAFIIVALIIGYAFAWVGHFFIEKNKPATFKYPLYSFIADWIMYKEILQGKISIRK